MLTTLTDNSTPRKLRLYIIKYDIFRTQLYVIVPNTVVNMTTIAQRVGVIATFEKNSYFICTLIPIGQHHVTHIRLFKKIIVLHDSFICNFSKKYIRYII